MSTEPKPVPPNHWMISESGQQEGPYTLEQMRDKIRAGRLSALTLVWTPGMSEWKPWSQMPELQPEAIEPPSRGAGMAAGAKAVFDDALRRASSSNWQDWLLFRRTFTPLIVPVLFWAGLALNGILFLILLFTALFSGSFIAFVLGLLSAVIWLVLATVALRIVCELLLLAFRIGDLLAEIRDCLPQPMTATPTEPRPATGTHATTDPHPITDTPDV